jgi:hypothetical protein
VKRITALFIALAVTLVSVSAFAKTSDALIRHVPHDSRILVGLEIPKLKKSFLFSEVLSVLRDQPEGKNILSFILAEDAFDVEKDVDSMLLAFDEAPTSPQASSAPASVVVLQGKLDSKKVLASARKKLGKLKMTKHGSVEVYSGSGIDMAFVDDGTLVLADQGKHAKNTWKAVNDPEKAASANPQIQSLMKLIPGQKGLWVAMETGGLTPTPDSPEMDGAAMTLDVASGVALDFHSKFQKEKDAKAALDQFKQMKSQSGNDPLVAMLGAKPLLDNLDAKLEKKTVLAMTTSMSEAELKSLIARLKAMSQAPPPTTGAPTSGPQSGPTTGKPANTAPTGKGANADFN